MCENSDRMSAWLLFRALFRLLGKCNLTLQSASVEQQYWFLSLHITLNQSDAILNQGAGADNWIQCPRQGPHCFLQGKESNTQKLCHITLLLYWFPANATYYFSFPGFLFFDCNEKLFQNMAGNVQFQHNLNSTYMKDSLKIPVEKTLKDV